MVDYDVGDDINDVISEDGDRHDGDARNDEDRENDVYIPVDEDKGDD